MKLLIISIVFLAIILLIDLHQPMYGFDCPQDAISTTQCQFFDEKNDIYGEYGYGYGGERINDYKPQAPIQTIKHPIK